MKLSTSIFLFAGAAQAILVPNPAGPYSLASRVLDLTDESRLDPYAPPGTARRILLSMFLPLDANQSSPCVPEVLPYLPPETLRHYTELAPGMGLPSEMLGEFEVEYCKLSRCERAKDGVKFPVAIFSTGHSVSRLLYTTMARSLASRGYVVIAIDHPYDADVVEFPDGTVITGPTSTANVSEILKDLQVRTGDISFVIDQLHNKTMLDRFTRGFPHEIDLDNIAVFGHSLGGAAAATVLRDDDRIKGCMDFDGTIWGSVVTDGLSKPFVLVSTQESRDANALLNWDTFWAHLRGGKVELATTNTTHVSFLDIPVLLTVYDLPEELKPTEEAVWGVIGGGVMEKIVDGISTAFVDLVFRGTEKPLCEIAHRFSQVTTVRSSFAQQC